MTLRAASRAAILRPASMGGLAKPGLPSAPANAANGGWSYGWADWCILFL